MTILRATLLLVLVGMGVGPLCAVCQELNIGVPAFSRRVSLFDEADWAGRIVRMGTTQGLVRSDGIRFELDLSDRLQVNESGTEWRFRIPERAQFSHGKPVLPRDIISSVARCQKSLARWTIEQATADVPPSERWMVLKNERAEPKDTREFPHLLARCPILEAKSAQVFGEELGFGSSFVGSGAYWVQTFGNGRSVVLERESSRLAGVAASATITIRGVTNPEQGLVALRSGTLDILFAAGDATVSRAREDETLAISQCFGEPVIHRQRLAFSCMDIGAIQYVG